uniref:Uncharacterized protein n=1 Tax=Leviviridae sp. TaxID=2027243 RepID=A0A514D4E7_9VIRU|nr:MAG: hypothetical protein H4Bulk46289e3808_000004 [Leviviridae sp.]
MSGTLAVLNAKGAEDLSPRRYAYGIDRSTIRHD